MKYLVYAKTAIGNTRRINEDNFYVNGFYANIEKNESYSFSQTVENNCTVAVFDGVGGASYGKSASYIAAATLDDINRKEQPLSLPKMVEYLNIAVCNKGEELKAHIGTTIVMARFECEMVEFCNVGDSRSYLFRNGKLIQTSEDHNEYTSLNRYQISCDSYLYKNRLTQYLGISEDEFLIEPYFYDECLLNNDDTILLCSDGLISSVTEKQMSEILSSENTLNSKGDKLIEYAMKYGGEDNITVVLVKYINSL